MCRAIKAVARFKGVLGTFRHTRLETNCYISVAVFHSQVDSSGHDVGIVWM